MAPQAFLSSPVPAGSALSHSYSSHGSTSSFVKPSTPLYQFSKPKRVFLISACSRRDEPSNDNPLSGQKRSLKKKREIRKPERKRNRKRGTTDNSGYYSSSSYDGDSVFSYSDTGCDDNQERHEAETPQLGDPQSSKKKSQPHLHDCDKAHEHTEDMSDCTANSDVGLDVVYGSTEHRFAHVWGGHEGGPAPAPVNFDFCRGQASSDESYSDIMHHGQGDMHQVPQGDSELDALKHDGGGFGGWFRDWFGIGSHHVDGSHRGSGFHDGGHFHGDFDGGGFDGSGFDGGGGH